MEKKINGKSMEKGWKKDGKKMENQQVGCLNDLCMLLLLIFLVMSTTSFAQTKAVKTQMGFQLFRNGKPYYVKGLGGEVNFDKMVEVLGGYGEYVEKPEDIRPALERASVEVSKGRVALVNVVTDWKARAATAAFTTYQT